MEGAKEGEIKGGRGRGVGWKRMRKVGVKESWEKEGGKEKRSRN